jgi:hypothetical protein
MMLSDANIQMRRDVQGISADLKWSVVELRGIAQRLELAGNMPDAQAVFRMIQIFQQGEARLEEIATAIAGNLTYPSQIS